MTDNPEDIMRSLGKIEGLLTGVTEWRGNVDKRLNNHADRLSILERWQAKVLGVAAIISIPAVAAFVIKALT